MHNLCEQKDLREFEFEINQRIQIASAAHDQIRLTERLDDVQARINDIRTIQSQTETELDALMPSILDKAFRAEL